MKSKSLLVDEQFPKYNCAQTVFSLFASELGIDETTALKIASGFAGGMNSAETCGAVTGAYMVIGMKHGHSTSNPEDKVNTKLLIQKFNEKFKVKHESLICKKLLGFDISTPEGLSAARENDVFHAKCPALIKTSCKILEEDF